MSTFWAVLFMCSVSITKKVHTKYELHRISSFQNDLLTDFYKDFFAYGEMNRSQSPEIDYVLTKIDENDADFFTPCK